MLRLVVLCLIIGVATAATARGRLPKKPAHLAHKEGCYIEEIKDVIPHNSQITPIGICRRISCGREWINYASCGLVFSDDPKCHRVETDLTKPYPHCCPTYKCETENQI